MKANNKNNNLFGVEAGNAGTGRRAFKGSVTSPRGFFETQQNSAPTNPFLFLTPTNSAHIKSQKHKQIELQLHQIRLNLHIATPTYTEREKRVQAITFGALGFAQLWKGRRGETVVNLKSLLGPLCGFCFSLASLIFWIFSSMTFLPFFCSLIPKLSPQLLFLDLYIYIYIYFFTRLLFNFMDRLFIQNQIISDIDISVINCVK